MGKGKWSPLDVDVWGILKGLEIEGFRRMWDNGFCERCFDEYFLWRLAFGF